MLKIFVVFVICFSLLSGLCGCAANRDRTNDTGQEGAVFNYKTEYLTETSDNNLINIEIPVFEGENEKKIISKKIKKTQNHPCPVGGFQC